MNSTQRIIKYCAMAFAIALMVGILSAIAAAVSGIDRGFSFNGNVEYMDFTKEYTGIENLDIENYSGRMNIQMGTEDKLIVKAIQVPDTISVEVKGKDTLTISDKDHIHWSFHFNFWDDSEEDESEITVILPKDFVGKNVIFENNSGRAEIEGLSAKELEINGGSGSIIASDIKADKFELSLGSGEFDLSNAILSNGSIDGGSGVTQLKKCTLNDIEINGGSGAIRIEGSMSGKNQLDGGSGSIMLNLENVYSSYRFEIEKHSGTISINGNRVDDGTIKNPGAVNELEIEGDSGAVSINFAQ